jgi:hypothetical protein
LMRRYNKIKTKCFASPSVRAASGTTSKVTTPCRARV